VTAPVVTRLRRLQRTGELCTSIAALNGRSAKADTVAITTQGVAWQSNGQSSTTGGVPLTVPVKTGDTIQVHVGSGHGLVTINKPGNKNPAVDTSFVNACGDSPKSTAVLQEINCTAGVPSNFGKGAGDMTFQVLNQFSADLNFWCVIHKSIMWGVITLKP
jgi:hypothetical protein